MTYQRPSYQQRYSVKRSRKGKPPEGLNIEQMKIRLYVIACRLKGYLHYKTILCHKVALDV